MKCNKHSNIPYIEKKYKNVYYVESVKGHCKYL